MRSASICDDWWSILLLHSMKMTYFAMSWNQITVVFGAISNGGSTSWNNNCWGPSANRRIEKATNYFRILGDRFDSQKTTDESLLFLAIAWIQMVGHLFCRLFHILRLTRSAALYGEDGTARIGLALYRGKLPPDRSKLTPLMESVTLN